MDLKRCGKGHFYNVDKYKVCPHCQRIEKEDISVTFATKNDIIVEKYEIEQQIPPDQTNLGQQLEGVIGTKPPFSKMFDLTADIDQTTRFSYCSDSHCDLDPVVGWLVCIKGSCMGKSFDIKNGKNFIGRSSSMDIVIPEDLSVSRDRHAVIIYDPKGNIFLLEPGKTKSVIFLDNEAVLSPQMMKKRQMLTIGKNQFLFVPFCDDSFTWQTQIRKNTDH